MAANTGSINLTLKVRDDGSVTISKFAGRAKSELNSAGGAIRTGITKAFNAVRASATSALSFISKQVFSLKGLLAGLGVGYLAKEVLDTASGFEQMQLSLNTITKGEGAEWFRKLNEWAMKMPVNTQAAIKSFTMMRAMGLQPTIEQMTTLVDTTSALGGNEDTLEGIARALAQISTKGKVSAEELMQLAERGVPVFEILKAKFGDVETSSIVAGDAINAIFEGLNERFGGQSEQMQSTWKGMWESLKGYWTEFQRLVMESGVLDWLKERLGAIIAKLDEWYQNGQLQEWASNVGTAITEVFGDIEDWIYNVVMDIDEYINTEFGSLQNAGTEITKLFEGWRPILTSVLEFAKAIGTAFKYLWDLSGKIEQAINAIGRAIKSAWGYFERFSQSLNSVGDWVTGGTSEYKVDFTGTGSTKLPITEKIDEINGMLGDLSATKIEINADMTSVTRAISDTRKSIAEINTEILKAGHRITVAGMGASYLAYGIHILGWHEPYGSYDSGTDYVPRTGPYVLHQGEKVIPANQSAQERAGVNIGSITINMQGGGNAEQIADELDKAIANRIKYGRSRIAAALA